MEEVEIRYKQLLQAYSRLTDIVEKFTQQQQKTPDASTENERMIYRDALIKRFEFCYNLTWKFLKLLLEKKHGIQAPSPRTAFQESDNKGLLTREQTQLLLKTVEARNLTTPATAEKIALFIVEYHPHLIHLITHLKDQKE